MSSTSGSSWPRSWSNATEHGSRIALREVAILFGLGVAIAVLQASLRFPLRLPGHHGLEAMMLMTLGRLLSEGRWSATLVGSSAAAAALVLGGGHEPLQPLLYLMPGLLLDFVVRATPRWVRSSQFALLLLLPLIAGLGWAMRPLVKWVGVQGFGLKFGSLLAGPLYPISTHFAFGTAGALLAVVLWRFRKESEATSH